MRVADAMGDVPLVIVKNSKCRRWKETFFGYVHLYEVYQ